MKFIKLLLALVLVASNFQASSAFYAVSESIYGSTNISTSCSDVDLLKIKNLKAKIKNLKAKVEFLKKQIDSKKTKILDLQILATADGNDYSFEIELLKNEIKLINRMVASTNKQIRKLQFELLTLLRKCGLKEEADRLELYLLATAT